MKKRRLAFSLLAFALTLLCVVPYGYVLFASFMGKGFFSLNAYYEVFLAENQYLLRFWKSLGLSLIIGLLQVFISAMAGYGFAKSKFPGKNALFFLLMVMMILPLQVTLVPNYLVLKELNLLNTYYALALPAIFAPLGTFIMTRSFQSVPNEIIEAARLDGCRQLAIVWRICAPMNRSGLSAWAQDRQAGVQAQRFISAENFLFHYADDKAWDILLLDIEMGAMDGVSLAKRIRQENELVQIVFITGFPDFMAEGYEVSALHYLMKPVAKEKLFAVLDKAAGNLGKNDKQLAISFDRQTELVPLSKITYIEAQKQYVVVHTDKQEYRMKASLADTEKELDEYFFKCQRSFIVNLRHVLRIGSDSVMLKNGAEVPISRGMAQKIGKEIIRLF